MTSNLKRNLRDFLEDSLCTQMEFNIIPYIHFLIIWVQNLRGEATAHLGQARHHGKC